MTLTCDKCKTKSTYNPRNSIFCICVGCGKAIKATVQEPTMKPPKVLNKKGEINPYFLNRKVE